MTAQLFREIGPTQAKRMNKLITLVVCMMIACVKGQTCTTIPMDNKSACTVCTKNESFVNCTKSHSSGTLLLNETDCISQCCNTSSTDNSTQHSVCKTSKAIESKSHADTNVTIFILIIVFTIAGVVCCYCNCSYCLKKRR
jgi:hypothetical protein